MCCNGVTHISSNLSKIDHLAAFLLFCCESCKMFNFTHIQQNVRHPNSNTICMKIYKTAHFFNILTKMYDLGIFSWFCTKMYIFSMFCIILLICTKMDIFGNIYENIQNVQKCMKWIKLYMYTKLHVYLYKFHVCIQDPCTYKFGYTSF